MLKIEESFNYFPHNYKVDPKAIFQPGQIGSIKILNGECVIGICDGLNPEGIIDDLNSNKIRTVSIDERLCCDSDIIDINKCTTKDISIELKYKNIIEKSFISTIPLKVNYKDGVAIVPKGTMVYDDIYGYKSCLISTINYAAYIIVDRIDSTTNTSKRVFLWNRMFIGSTDMFDTSVPYIKYDCLYCINGLFTTKTINIYHKRIGFVLEEPTAKNPVLRFFYDPDRNINPPVHCDNEKYLRDIFMH